ncbi:hypothetical protein [Marinobacter zhanjiangensis]|uniref:hypothetical protein n=1 Tax=Marinobacter zhanjiangensis TaxID=578215 RepID=UPI0016729097|nr:hypothetical protein [Marinobacter zhanjiangensis]
MQKRTATLIAGLCLLAALAAEADTLTGQSVSRFMASMAALQASEAFSGHFKSAREAVWNDREFPGSLMPSELSAMVEGGAGYQAFKTIIEAHGFEEPQAWARAGDRILLALMSLDMNDRLPEMQARLVRMREQMSANPRFSDDQKQRMQQMIDRTAQLFNRVAQVPETDREAVRPHRAALKQALDYQSVK